MKPKEWFKKVWRFLSSLKLAVFCILGIAISVATGTVLESVYDTPTAQYYVYRSLWFHAFMGLLGVNILVVALSRYPWKVRHTPFLMAHLGILMMLSGSWLTDQFGVDGNLRVTEGETQSGVDIDSNLLYLSEKNVPLKQIPIPFLPPGVEFGEMKLKALKGSAQEIVMDQYLSHAEPIFTFLPDSDSSKTGNPKPALKLKIKGGPMRISQEVWLWAGEPIWAKQQWGPAILSLGARAQKAQKKPDRGPELDFTYDEKTGELHFYALSSKGKIETGTIKKNEIKGHVLQPEWNKVTFTVLDWIENAKLLSGYKPSSIQYGEFAPSPAIHLSLKNAAGRSVIREIWLSLGEQATFQNADAPIDIGFFRRRFTLPFSIKLEKFTIDRDPGSNSPAAYSSRVEAIPKGGSKGPETVKTVISMNEPLEYQGFTLYQASFENALPRPVTSILSVNRDPGRGLKYGGSILIVLGAILLFTVKKMKGLKAK